MILSGPQFVGREPILESIVQRASQGLSTALTGPTGIGRTRTLSEAARRLETGGRRVTRLAATASASSVPFGIFLGLLDRPTLLRISAEDALGRAALVRASVLALEPSTVLVDEASLLDPGSAAFLLELARGATAVVLATTTGRRVPDAVRAMVDEGLAQTIRLDPLDVPASGALAASMLGGAVDGGLATALVDVAEGNPASIQDVLQAAERAGALQFANGLWRLGGELPAPAAARKRAGADFLAMTPDARDWLCAVAIADEIADDVAERLCADTVADEVARARWTFQDHRSQTTRMRRAAQTEGVLETVGSRQRRSVTRRLLAAFDELSRPLTDRERIASGAWRLELGSDLPVDVALELGTLTSLAAPEASERFLRHAVANGGGAAAEVVLAEHLKRTNRLDEAEQLLGTTSAASGDQHSADEIAKVLALVAGFGSRHSAQAIAVLDAHMLAHGEQPNLLSVRGGLLRTVMRYQEALVTSERLRKGAVGFASVFAGINEILVRIELGDPWGALQVVDLLRSPALQTVDRIPEGPVMLDWMAGLAPAAACLDIRTAEVIADRSYQRMLESGMHAVRTPFAHLLGGIRSLQGDIDSAVHLLREAEGLPGIWHDSWLPLILADLAIALIRAGDIDEAAAAIGRAHAGAVAPSQAGSLRLAEAQLIAAQGDGARAAVIAREVATRARRHGARVQMWDALFVAMWLGDKGAAEELLREEPLPGVARGLQQDHAAAVISGDISAFDVVARRYWAEGHRYYAVETVRDTLARRKAEGSSIAATVERLSQWAAEVPSMRLPSISIGANGLTARELEVAVLVARGLPDRGVADELGISVRTAQTHLMRAFTKLGVHRRSELVGLVPE